MGIIKSGDVSNVLGVGRIRQLRIKKGKSNFTICLEFNFKFNKRAFRYGYTGSFLTMSDHIYSRDIKLWNTMVSDPGHVTVL